YGVKYLTVYAFSTENWSRPEKEVSQLMKLFVEFFDKYDPELAEEGIRVRFTGDIDSLPEDLKRVCREGEERSKDRPKMQLIVAFNYGGRREITYAAQRLAEQVRRGEIDPSDITEDSISANMYLPDVPDPELIIRPSGEMRLSNFLLWESAYSELWVSDTLWPDFGYEELTQAFRDYAKRDRRFGGLSAKDSDEGDKQ
ncbi:MAG: di-trans,poly-cis-decaprenylcistransferase, partial [Clostridiales bacterium]|nr:di-trans,poly-cis-decaprenylcistransferase [Clostridiales bacterium]